MKRVIIFGGSGFLGSYVADELTGRGYDVVIADIKPSLYRSEKQKFLFCDITDQQCVESAVSDKVDFVYNFAGLADINEAIRMPLRTMQLNVMGNLNILEACRNNNVSRFIYASSAYAFSNKGSFYGISKHTCEKLIEEYYNSYGLKFSIVRYGSLYGERADEHNYIYNLLKKALLERKIIVKHDADDIREYIHAKDAARLSVDIIESKDYVNELIVLTGFEKMRRRELFQMIREILNDEVEYECSNEIIQGHYSVTPYSFHPSLARKLMSNPFIDMGQGLVECIRQIHSDIEQEKDNATYTGVVL